MRDVACEPDPRVPPAASAARGRGASIDQAALEAARELLAAGGVKGLTMEGVAARTGIGKPTLYRRWRSKEDLALAVVLDMARTAIAAPAGADVREALVSYLGAAIDILRSTLMGQVMQGLTSDLATDPQMAVAFRGEVIGLRDSHLEELVQRGVEAGQLRPGVNVALVQDLLFGPVYYRLLYSGEPLEDDLAERIVNAVLASLATDPAAEG